MRQAALLAVAVVMVMGAAVSGCTGGDDTPAEAESEPTGSSETDSWERIQQVLDDAQFSADDIGMTADESYQHESGLRASTLAFCGDKPDPVDEQRLARSQRWWHDDDWPDADAGGHLVGLEIVLFEPSGVGDAIAVVEAVPRVCPSAEFPSGTSATFEPADLSTSLPWGSVALRDEWTYPDGVTVPGLTVAVPVGDLLGLLYIRGNESAVHRRVGDLAAVLERNLSQAAEALEEVRGG